MEFLLADFGGLVEQNDIAELDLLNHEILNILFSNIPLGQVLAARELILHAKCVHYGDYTVQTGHSIHYILHAHLRHGAYGLGNRLRLAYSAGFDYYIVELVHGGNLVQLLHEIHLKGAAYATVLQSHQAVVLLTHNSSLLDQVCIYIDFTYVVDYHGELDAASVVEYPVEECGLSASQITCKQKYWNLIHSIHFFESANIINFRYKLLTLPFLMKTRYIYPILLVTLLLASCKQDKTDIIEPRFIASDRPYATLYSIDEETGVVSVVDSVLRGSKVEVIVNAKYKSNKIVYLPLKARKGPKRYAMLPNLSTDSLALVLEKQLYVRTPASVLADTASSAIAGQVEKGRQVSIVGYDKLQADGTVHRYKIQVSDTLGYVYSKYLVPTQEEALSRYMPEKYDSLHLAIKNRFGAGKAIDCDFFPRPKPEFKDNRMPESCYSLYINFSPANLSKIDEYIELAKQTKINTFVIDIKDNECPGFRSEAMLKYSPTNYNRSTKNGEKLYKRAVSRLHEEGFYVVARITCFKDSYFVKDNPECAITEIETGEPFKHNKSFWPSAFNRRVWEFNVELAKEAIRKFGFNEINFDYVRFPDRMTKIEDRIDYHNCYGETKVQAIQRFVQYACDEIHELGAYVSIDVFGECANPGYTTAYGQYWPALSNIADVMCGMPYPDHFPDGFYGIKKPWNHPYEILYAWGQRVQARQKATPTPAKVRTWVQAYHVMRHVDPNGIDYNAENIEKEIRGLFDAGLTGGYTTWLSSSNINKYREQAPAFCIDYYAETMQQ